MQAMRCDRCGEFYIPYGPQREVYNSNGLALTLKMPNGNVTPNLYLDLCPACMMDTMAFLMVQPDVDKEPEKKDIPEKFDDEAKKVEG